jgi:hypothetical protein
LFYKKDSNTNEVILLAILHVDNIMCCGTDEEVDWLKKKVREHNNITDLGRMKKYLGIWYEWDRDEDGPFVKATMDDMVETIIGDHEKHVERSIEGAKAPGFPSTTLQRGEDKEAEGIET